MKAVIFDAPGAADVLTLAEIPIPEPTSSQLLIKVKATAVNRADILQRKGKYPPPAGESSILGLEIAGTVAKIGADVTEFELGQPIFGLVGGGGYAQYCVIDAQMALPLPSFFNFQQGAAVPEVFFTASETLFQLGHLAAGDTVLIQAGSSGVGTAAIQLARAKGARVIFTSSSAEKITLIEQRWPSEGVNYKSKDFVKDILQLTQQQGVDVILDVIGNGYVDQHLQLLKPQGRLIQIAVMGGADIALNLRPLLQKRLQIKGFMLRTQSLLEKRAITQRFAENSLPLFALHQLAPVIDRTFALEDVQDAHRYLESNQHIGKVVLTIG